MGSLEEVTTENQSVQAQNTELPHSISFTSNADFYEPQNNTPSRQTIVSIRDNPCYGQNATKTSVNNITETLPNSLEAVANGRLDDNKSQSNCDASPYKNIR